MEKIQINEEGEYYLLEEVVQEYGRVVYELLVYAGILAIEFEDLDRGTFDLYLDVETVEYIGQTLHIPEDPFFL